MYPQGKGVASPPSRVLSSPAHKIPQTMSALDEMRGHGEPEVEVEEPLSQVGRVACGRAHLETHVRTASLCTVPGNGRGATIAGGS